MDLDFAKAHVRMLFVVTLVRRRPDHRWSSPTGLASHGELELARALAALVGDPHAVSVRRDTPERRESLAVAMRAQSLVPRDGPAVELHSASLARCAVLGPFRPRATQSLLFAVASQVTIA